MIYCSYIDTIIYYIYIDGNIKQLPSDVLEKTNYTEICVHGTKPAGSPSAGSDPAGH